MSNLILLVEDDPVLGPSLQQRLVLEGFSVVHAQTMRQARDLLGKQVPNFILSDIRLPDGSGADLLGEVISQHGAVPMMFMTAYGSLDQAVDLVRGGARDYLAKPFDLDELVVRIKDVLQNAALTPASEDPFAAFGLSPAMHTLRGTLDRLADIDLPVLLVGETGTGKEVAARYLHAARQRGDHGFEAVNCGQLSAELADSLLFGHERGAFTGAHEKRAGVLEMVSEGTLLLDEIGETSTDLQVKLLRVLEERRFRRVGGSQDLSFEGRIVCATNRDLNEAVADGTFRQDLLFRINVVTLHMPPLRERPEEISPLMQMFARSAAVRMGVSPKDITPAAEASARAHDWPGNIRELRNRVERAVALSNSGTLDRADMFPEQPEHAARPTNPAKVEGGFLSLSQARDEAERTHIARALKQTDSRLQDAAKLLGISRTTLWERMRRHGMER